MYYTKTGGGALDGALATINVNGNQYQLGKDAGNDVGGIAKLFGGSGAFEGKKASTDGAYDAKTVYDAISSLGNTSALSITKDGNAATNPTVSADGSTYVLKQGTTSIATFNIAKDIFVRDGKVVYGTYNSSTDTFTADTAAADYSNAFIELTIDEDNDGTTVTKKIYIPAASLLKAYTAGNATGAKIEVAVSSDNKISATVSSGFQTEIDNKATKVSGATSGNFAGLDANGNLTDSGHKHSDYQAAGSYKTTQTAVTDPTASGNAASFIDTISQNANGAISVTKKYVQPASASQDGLMSAAHYSKVEAISASVSGDVLSLTTQAAA